MVMTFYNYDARIDENVTQIMQVFNTLFCMVLVLI